MLTTDYPKEKMEWIIVEDTDIDKKDQMATDKIINFQVNHPTISIKYIPIEGRVSIGEKRNYGVKHATHEIILFMDDDDHCPITAFRRRVAWLLHSDRDIVCCTTLPLYDLKTGVSAVSIPPFHLPLSQRISEATLTFTKAMWLERPFPDVSLAEGEAWIEGREAKVVEIPPQQIIVAFTHGTNQSSRIVPNGGNVSCFWGFPDEYLHFIHGLAGVQLVKE
jgi:glycosyltransferase involved in cell wall biosynthesis